MSTRRRVAAILLALAVTAMLVGLTVSLTVALRMAEGTPPVDTACTSHSEARSAFVGERLSRFVRLNTPDIGPLWNGPKSRDLIGCDKRDLMRVHTFALVSEGPLTIRSWQWLHCPQHAPCVVLETS
jgi:hypothetical protein